LRFGVYHGENIFCKQVVPELKDEIGFGPFARDDKSELLELSLLEQLVFDHRASHQQRR